MAIGTTILVRDVLYRVSTLLQDIAPTQFVRWSERELVALLNDGQRACAKYMPHSCTRLDAIRLQPGTRQSISKLLTAAVKAVDGSTPPQQHGQRWLDARCADPGHSARVTG